MARALTTQNREFNYPAARGSVVPPVVIESAGARTREALVIRAHHDLGGLPGQMTLGLVEPLRECCALRWSVFSWDPSRSGVLVRASLGAVARANRLG
jgi:hypothetical protein